MVLEKTLKSLLQHHSSKALILWHSAFFIVQLWHPYMTTGKTIALTRWTFVGKVNSLLFNMLSRLIMGISRQEHWSDLPFPSPVDYILSELSTMTRLSCVVLHPWLSFIELDKAVVHVIRLVSFLWLCFQSFCPLMPSLHTYHLPGISLTLDVRYLFMAAPAKHSHCSLPWTWGISSWPLLPTIYKVPHQGSPIKLLNIH